MDEKLTRFRAWLRTEGVTQEKLRVAMGYSQAYVCQVLGGRKKLYPVFVECMKIALLDKLCIPWDRVEEEITKLLG